MQYCGAPVLRCAVCCDASVAACGLRHAGCGRGRGCGSGCGLIWVEVGSQSVGPRKTGLWCVGRNEKEE